MESVARGVALAVLGSVLIPSVSHAQPDAYFEIRVVDETGAAAPCVHLRTVNDIVYVTDENGRVAFSEPGLMGIEVYFHVSEGGVERDEDFVGYRGARLTTTPGGTGTIEARRTSSPGCAPGDLESRRLDRGALPPEGFMRVDVRDDATGRGVPLVELTIGERRWITDSAGVVAIDPLDLEGAQEATLRSHGYSFAGAQALDVVAGGHAMLTAHRENVAERLYRVTGGGIYRDSVLLGLPVPLEQPVIDGLVLGQDTVFSTIFRGELFFLWGDTLRPSYPLGNFQTSSATARLPADGLDPSEGIDLDYFVDPATGFSRAMAPPSRVSNMSTDGRSGVTWLGTLIAVPDASGVERLHATFGVYGQDFERFRFGMLSYDEEADEFVDALEYTRDDAYYPREGAFIVAHGDARYVYTHVPIRIPARSEALVDESTYEAFTPLIGDTLVRDEDGRLEYAWRRGERRVTDEDAVPENERLFGHEVEVESGAPLSAHENGSTEINEYTGRFLRILTPGGLGRLGETWFALADTPMGPWVAAQQIVTHDRYTFYNPRQHRPLDEDFGQRVYFEATYTRAFSATAEPTPRYDYNQMMYRLDLDAPELAVPVPIYRSERGELGDHSVLAPTDAPIRAEFMAPLGPRPGVVPVAWSGPDCEARRLVVGEDPPTPPLFYALPASHDPERHQQRLYEVFLEGDDTPTYTTEDAPGARVVAVVWRNPVSVPLPVADYLPTFRADAGADRCMATAGPLMLDEGDWRLDGEPVASGASVDVGLHVVERVETRADGFLRTDSFLLRVGASPPPPPPATDGGCGCGVARGGDAAPPVGVFLFALVAGLRRAQRRRRDPGS